MNNSESNLTQVTTDQLVTNTVTSLRNDGQSDAELLDILSKNVVKLDPAETAVSDAVKAIEELAAKRAEKPDNGSTDHD